MRSDKCRHFNGVQNEMCESKIKYPRPIKDIPCFGKGKTECEGYVPFTTEELEAKEKEMQRNLDLMNAGLSSCCEAPFDFSHVIPDGQFKGHGPRFCSECKALCFMV